MACALRRKPTALVLAWRLGDGMRKRSVSAKIHLTCRQTLRNLRFDRRFPTIGVEASWTFIASICSRCSSMNSGIDDAAILIDQEQPHWQRHIFPLYVIIDGIDQHRHLEVKVDLTSGRHSFPLFVGGRFPIGNSGLEILRNPPTVIGMSFPSVDEQKVHLIFVVLVNFVQAHGMITKRRSGIGAEDQPRGLPPQIGQLDGFAGAFPLPVEHIDFEIRRR